MQYCHRIRHSVSSAVSGIRIAKNQKIPPCCCWRSTPGLPSTIASLGVATQRAKVLASMVLDRIALSGNSGNQDAGLVARHVVPGFPAPAVYVRQVFPRLAVVALPDQRRLDRVCRIAPAAPDTPMWRVLCYQMGADVRLHATMYP